MDLQRRLANIFFSHLRFTAFGVGVMLVVSFAPLGCASEDSLSIIATVTDEFNQNVAAAIDVLWVVDNSESMAEEQQGIADQFSFFVSTMESSNVDYHIGVISTDPADQGLLHFGSSNTPVIDKNVANVASIFRENVNVGTSGSRVESAFETMSLAIGKGPGWMSPALASAPNTDFIREDASLFVIMVSDEDDKSFGPVSYYRRLIESYKGPGNESRISVSAIVGPASQGADDGGCSVSGRGNAQAGNRYVELAAQTGGIFTSICDDFAESLGELSISAAGLKSIFRLSALPRLGTVVQNCNGTPANDFCIRIDGTVLEPQDGRGWLFDEAQNAIFFGVNNLPPPQSKITIEYRKAGDLL